MAIKKLGLEMKYNWMSAITNNYRTYYDSYISIVTVFTLSICISLISAAAMQKQNYDE